MSNALVVRCRNPSEFIASVVERHRGFPLPRSEDEKTYLVFVGLEDEEEILELIPSPGGESVESPGRQGDLEEAGKDEGGEEYLGVHEEEEEKDDEGEVNGTPPHQARAKWVPRRIQVRYVPQDESMDDVYDEERRYHDNDSEEDESEAHENKRSFEGPPLRAVGGFGFGSAHAAGEEEEGREEKANKITGEDLIERLSRLPLELSGGEGGSEGIEADEGERDPPVDEKDEAEPDKLIAGQEFAEQFSQPRSHRGGGSGRSDKILGGAEERYHKVVHGSQRGPDEASQEQKIASDGLIDGGEGTRVPTANEVFSRSPQLHVPVLQEEPVSPVPDDILSTNSSPSSPLLGSGAVGVPGKTTKEEDSNGGNGEPKEPNETTSDGEKTRYEVTLERREEFTGPHGAGVLKEIYHAVKKVSPQPLPLCRQSVLQVREPESPIRPRPDEISPLTTPSNSPPNLNANEDHVKWDLAEASEDETLPYPATTLENLIATEHVDIIYLEDLETLHGFLEAMLLSPEVSAPNPPLLALWGLVSAHYQTNYFGGEGIGETVAQAVEAAAKSGRLLVLGEGYIEVDYGDGKGEVQEQCWVDVEVPILNMGSMIVGRTVEVRRILKRWCRFGEDLEDSEDGEEGGRDEHHGDEAEDRHGNEDGNEGDEGEDEDDGGSGEGEGEAMYEDEEVHEMLGAR